jgi:4-hydroxy-4-methyl-2-oxoglutarate aldolase
MADRLDHEHREHLANLAPEDLSDACDRLGISGYVPGISPLWPVERAVVGTVMTVELVHSGYPSATSSHLGARAIELARPGQVLVVDHKGRTDAAGWGGLLSEAASERGLAGTVIYGAARDVPEAQALAYPVFGIGSCPVSARGRVAERSHGDVIQCGDVTVNPGDVAVVGRAGLFILPIAAIASIMAVSAEIVEAQAMLAARLRDGEDVTAVMGANYERMLEDQ